LFGLCLGLRRARRPIRRILVLLVAVHICAITNGVCRTNQFSPWLAGFLICHWGFFRHG
jgi:hypothetical protein